MATTLYDSFLNPVKFQALDNVQLPNYVSRFMDDWMFRRTIQPWQQKVCFYQKWSTDDTVKIQYTSDVAPIVIRMYDENGYLVHTQAFATLQQDELQPTFFIREIAISLAGFTPGKYFFTRDVGGVITYSEPFELVEYEDASGICLEDQDPTLLLEYKHFEPIQGIKFFTDIEFQMRVQAWLRYKQPGSKDNIYEDQLLNQTLINSVPYRVFQFILGGPAGVPPWFINRVARIFSCSDVKIDGRLFTKAEGSTFEPIALEEYPMAGWTIDLREKLNPDGVTFEDDVVIEGIAAAAIIVDNKGFGIDGGDTSYQQIIYLQ